MYTARVCGCYIITLQYYYYYYTVIVGSALNENFMEYYIIIIYYIVVRRYCRTVGLRRFVCRTHKIPIRLLCPVLVVFYSDRGPVLMQ